MKIYNTLSKRKEEFVPLEEGKVKMYVCGPTVYNLIHIGNARPMIVFDTVRRYMEHKGYEVNFVSNFTDVDDKIIKKALEEGVDSSVISERYIEECKKDMKAMNVKPATTHPKATQEIGGMLEMINTLIEKGHAYAAGDGTVYFRTRSFKGYGKLSHKNLDDLQGGNRSLLVSGEDQKEDPLDFVLWKPRKEGEPYWESPWCKGRPGWHIECSAMSEKYLPLPLDIHGGGLDLIFPHHENEIAQTEAALDKPLARVWMHNGFVQVNSEKMSKSLGNFQTIRDILESYLPETLRFFLVGKHYRSPIDFSLANMDEAERGQKRVYECLRATDQALAAESGKKATPAALTQLAELKNEVAALDAAFMEALEDDCNTAAALGHLFSMTRAAGRVLDDKTLRAVPEGREVLALFRTATEKWDALLGLFGQEPAAFLASLHAMRARRKGVNVTEVERLIGERQQARAARDFARADAARDELAALGVEVRDTPEGPVWDIA